MASAVSAVVVGSRCSRTRSAMLAGTRDSGRETVPRRQLDKGRRLRRQGSQVTWRATKLLTRAGTYIVVPNNIISKNRLPTTGADPSGPHLGRRRRHLQQAAERGEGGDAGGDRAGAARAEDAGAGRAADGFRGSAITYRARFWIAEFEVDASPAIRCGRRSSTRSRGAASRSRIRSSRDVARGNLHERDPDPPRRHGEALLGDVQIFATLSEDERKQLAARSPRGDLRDGRDGRAPGRGRHVDVHRLLSGQVKVTILSRATARSRAPIRAASSGRCRC